jgi:tight adherence protein B
VGDVARLAATIAAVVQAGLPPDHAWGAVARTGGPCAGVCAAVTRAVEAGVPADRALTDLADAPSPGVRRAAPALRWLAVTLDVCRRTGAPVAAALDGLAAALEAEEAAAADRAAALAGPRATAVVLAALPLGGVALGLLVGADPLGTLVGTGPGRGCLALGVGAWVAGMWWTTRLVHRAARAGEAAG